jgi:hypothetical protein
MIFDQMDTSFWLSVNSKTIDIFLRFDLRTCSLTVNAGLKHDIIEIIYCECMSY